MTTEEQIFTQYRGKRVLLDANLLLLYLIGSFERKRIELFKRTSGFSAGDFDVLASLLTSFRSVVTTPHLLTEVSNLANSLPENIKPQWSEHFALQSNGLLELFEPAVNLMKRASFSRFGLADAAIQQVAQDTLIITEDFRLSGFLRAQGLPVLNFRDLLILA
jgi:hypothetical protein